MPRRILLEEFHLTFTVPVSTSDTDRELARRVLNGRLFRSTLKRAILRCIDDYPLLRRIRLTLAV